jgi:hypothetical protein
MEEKRQKEVIGKKTEERKTRLNIEESDRGRETA